MTLQKTLGADALIVDWNGTMFDDFWLMATAMQEIFKHYGVLPPSVETYRNELDASDIAGFYHAHGIPKSVTLDEMNIIRRRVVEKRRGELRLFSGARELIAAARGEGMFCGLVSAELPDMLLPHLSEFGLLKHFNKEWGGIGDKQRALSLMVENAGVDPARAVYVDDTVSGIAAAKRAGLQAIAVTEGYNSRRRIEQSRPDCIVKTIGNLLGKDAV